MSDSDDHIFLFTDKNAQQGPKPVLSLQVAKWDGSIGKAELQLFECDYEDETAKEAQQPKDKAEIATIEVELERNEPSGAEPHPPEWKLSKPNPKSPKGAFVKTAKEADFVLYLGGENRLFLKMPKEKNQKLHDEEGTYEIGLVLKQGEVHVDWLDSAHTALSVIPAPDPVRKMQGLKKSAGVGRFSDPKRKPSVKPEDAADKLDKETLALLQGKTGPLGDDDRIDCDGLRFSHFVKPGQRRAAVDAYHAKIKLSAPRKGKKDTHASHGKSDIEKAYFIVHDTGEIMTAPHRADAPSDVEFTMATADRGGNLKSVNGYICMDGNYCTLADLEDVRMGGTLAQWGKQGFMKYYCVGFESYPVIEKTHSASDTTYACVGWGTWQSVQYYFKWTHATLDTYADVYVFASMRANHLLTIANHNELDENHHNDPRGIDMQVFYDKITERLNAFGGLQLPKGVRYGPDKWRCLNQDQTTWKEGAPKYMPHPKSWSFPHVSRSWKE